MYCDNNTLISNSNQHSIQHVLYLSIHVQRFASHVSVLRHTLIWGAHDTLSSTHTRIKIMQLTIQTYKLLPFIISSFHDHLGI